MVEEGGERHSNHSSNLIIIPHISVFLENLSVPSHFNVCSCPVAKFGLDSETQGTAKLSGFPFLHCFLEFAQACAN